MSNEVVLKICNLTKRYGLHDEVIRGIDLDVNRKELFCLLGANGAGKTTLIKILCNLILPTSGKVSINGYDIVYDFEKVKRFISLVPGDERSFYWRLTGRQNMEFFAALYNLSRKEAAERIEELFYMLRIKEPDRVFHEYSSGEKQRLCIARALLNNPEVLFMDELTKDLDPISAKEIKTFIKNELVEKQGRTIFFSTHQLYEAEELADRIAFMFRGKIVAVGRLDELRKIVGLTNASIYELYNYFNDNYSSAK